MTVRNTEQEGKQVRRAGRWRLGVRGAWWGIVLGCLTVWGLVLTVILTAF